MANLPVQDQFYSRSEPQEHKSTLYIRWMPLYVSLQNWILHKTFFFIYNYNYNLNVHNHVCVVTFHQTFIVFLFYHELMKFHVLHFLRNVPVWLIHYLNLKIVWLNFEYYRKCFLHLAQLFVNCYISSWFISQTPWPIIIFLFLRISEL